MEVETPRLLVGGKGVFPGHSSVLPMSTFLAGTQGPHRQVPQCLEQPLAAAWTQQATRGQTGHWPLAG